MFFSNLCDYLCPQKNQIPRLESFCLVLREHGICDTLNFISLTVQSSQYKQSKSKLPLPLQANYRRADLILEFFKSSLTEMLGKHNIGNHKSVHDDLPIY
jgi:hypothetical protein